MERDKVTNLLCGHHVRQGTEGHHVRQGTEGHHVRQGTEGHHVRQGTEVKCWAVC